MTAAAARQSSSLGSVTAGLGWDVAKGLGSDVDLVPRPGERLAGNQAGNGADQTCGWNHLKRTRQDDLRCIDGIEEHQNQTGAPERHSQLVEPLNFLVT